MICTCNLLTFLCQKSPPTLFQLRILFIEKQNFAPPLGKSRPRSRGLPRCDQCNGTWLGNWMVPFFENLVAKAPRPPPPVDPEDPLPLDALGGGLANENLACLACGCSCALSASVIVRDSSVLRLPAHRQAFM